MPRLTLGVFSRSLLVAIALSTGLVACQQDESNPNDLATLSESETVDEANISLYSNADISEAVNAEYRVARGISAEEVYVESNEGIVQLSGTVDNLLAFDRAQRIAEMVKGVRSVVNNIEIKPPSIEDDALQADISAALDNDPAVEAWEVEAEVRNGIAILDGTVESWQEKQLVSRTVKGVEGAIGIENNITIDYETIRATGEIEEEVKSALRWDARIDSGDIEVSVDGDTVVLDGSVGSAFEKSLAESKAYVAGVQNVEVSNLTVTPATQERNLDDPGLQADVSDPEIEAAIEDALLYDPRVSSFDVTVSVNNGVVNLSGSVDNLKAKLAAAQDAMNTYGVWEVENNITVDPEGAISDAEIEENVQAAIERDPYLEPEQVNVAVSDGVVELDGAVDSYFEKWEAGDLAALTQGAVSVLNDLSVDYEIPNYQTYFYDWDPVLMDYDFEPMMRPDDVISEAIEQQLKWSPVVSSSGIQVDVSDGVATLSGNVDSQFASMTAAEEAYEGGAIDVVNDLQVEMGMR